MTARTKTSLALGSLLLAHAAPGLAADFEIIGFNLYATGISGDGAVVVGNTEGDYEAFRWTSGAGVQPLGRATNPVLGVGAGAPQVSADGTRISATILGADSTYATQGVWEAASARAGFGTQWTETMPPVPPDGGLIDQSYGSAWGISDDGGTLVGLYWRPGATDGLAHPCTWHASTGIVDLGTAGGNGRANDASFDGSVVVGWEEDPSFGTWWPTVWTGGTRTNLSTDDAFHAAQCVNAAGDVIGGYALNEVNGLLEGALWRWNGLTWDEELTGTLPGHHATFGLTIVNDMTPDGTFIVGFDRRSSPGDATGFVWTSETGIQSANAFLASEGVTVPAGLVVRTFTGISADGRTICGSGDETVAPFRPVSFVIHLDPPVSAPLAESSVVSLRLAPNPTRGGAHLSFALPAADRIGISLYDVAGRRVRTIAHDRPMPPGAVDVSWDGRDDRGRPLPAGIYFVRLTGLNARATKSLTVVR